MMALCIEGLMDVANSVAVTSAFPPALTTALLEKLHCGDVRELLGEQHYLDWVSGKCQHLVTLTLSKHVVTHGRHAYIGRSILPTYPDERYNMQDSSSLLPWHPGPGSVLCGNLDNLHYPLESTQMCKVFTAEHFHVRA